MTNPESVDFHQRALQAQREGRMCMTPPPGFTLESMQAPTQEETQADEAPLPNEPLL